MLDCLVLGAGIIGLSVAEWLANEPAYRGRKIRVVDRKMVRQVPGRTASTAAAGVLPAVSSQHREPIEQLTSLSHQLYPEWTDRIANGSGVDVEFRECGAIHLARQIGEAAALRVDMLEKQAEGVRVQELNVDQVRELEPEIRDVDSLRCAFRLADECLVRPRRLIEALTISIAKLGVTLDQVETPVSLSVQGDECVAIIGAERIQAKAIVVATGPWSTELLLPLGFDIGVEPFRGQMVMWNTGSLRLKHVINEGPRYLLGRNDGRIVAGSTVEEVGFDSGTTESGISELTQFAGSLVPRLAEFDIEESWAGLRPGSRDGRPSIGRVRGFSNLIVATGHFRAGIHLAPVTAKCVCELVLGQTPSIDLEPFAPKRN